jgi:flagellar basal body-associated protein FliL
MTSEKKDASPKPKKKNKSLLVVVIILGSLILLCGMCSIIILIIGYFSPPELMLESPETNKWDATEPTQEINLYCSGLKELKLNDEVFSAEEMNKICSTSEEYELRLKDGENNFTFKGTGLRDQKVSLTITIDFDKSAYDSQVAEEEKEREEEEAKEAQKREAEENARREDEEEAIKEWKTGYKEIKQNEINVSIENSDAMIVTFQNSTDPYQTRNLAKTYEDYFLQECDSIAEDLENPPEEVREDVDNLVSHYSDYCMYNEFLASRVIDYLEAETVSKQYEHLDMISYYQDLVKTAKVGINANISLIDEAIK